MEQANWILLKVEQIEQVKNVDSLTKGSLFQITTKLILDMTHLFNTTKLITNIFERI